MKNKNWLGILTAFLLMTSAGETTTTDPTAELAKKLSPQELAAIEKEAAKLKEGKTDESAKPDDRQPEHLPQASEAKEAQKKADPVRQRPQKPYQTMYQGIYPQHDITQQPGDALTKKSIKPLNPSSRDRF